MNPIRTYDVLSPVIQTSDEAKVDVSSEEAQTSRSILGDRSRFRGADTEESLEMYAKHLLETVEIPSSPPNGNHLSPRLPPLSPSRIQPRMRVLSPSSPIPDPLSSVMPPKSMDRLDVPGNGIAGKGFRPRQGSFVEGDDQLVDEGGDEAGCGEAVEILSRNSSKSKRDSRAVPLMSLIA